MVEKTLTQKIKQVEFRASNLLYFEDVSDNIDGTGIVVDDAAYDTGGFLDRDYDVRIYKNLSMQIKNIGANSIDITILGTTKDFTDLDADLVDADFTETELAEEAVAVNAVSTIYNLNRQPDGKPAITAVRLRAKETVAVNPGTVRANIKAL